MGSSPSLDMGFSLSWATPAALVLAERLDL
jgi:hypothetical protein